MDIRIQLDAARDAATSMNETADAYALSSRDMLDAVLAKVLAFGQSCLLPSNADAVLDIMQKRQIRPADPRKGQNPFLQFIYCVDGDFDPKLKRKWNKKSENKWNLRRKLVKYAGVLRLADDEKITPEDFPNWVATFAETHKHPTTGEPVSDRLKGAMDVAAAKWGKPRVQVPKTTLDKAATEIPAAAQAPSPATAPSERRFFYVLAFDDGLGTRHYLSEVEATTCAAERTAKALVEAGA